MEKIMWFIQSITAGHAGMVQATQRDHQQGQVSRTGTAIAQDSRDNPAEQPWLKGEVYAVGSWMLGEGLGSLSLGLLALGEGTLLEKQCLRLAQFSWRTRQL